MDAHPTWYDSEQLIIYVRVKNHWSWENVYNTIDTIRLMMFETQQREIGLLVDMTEVSTHPSGVEQHLSQILNALPLKIQYVCTASRDRWVHMVYDVILDVYDNLKGNYCAVETHAEAESFLSDKLGRRIRRTA